MQQPGPQGACGPLGNSGTDAASHGACRAARGAPLSHQGEKELFRQRRAEQSEKDRPALSGLAIPNRGVRVGGCIPRVCVRLGSLPPTAYPELGEPLPALGVGSLRAAARTVAFLPLSPFSIFPQRETRREVPAEL